MPCSLRTRIHNYKMLVFQEGIPKQGIVYPSSNRGIKYSGRLNLARGWRSSQAFGCSPIKKLRELGSNRQKEPLTSSKTHGGFSE